MTIRPWMSSITTMIRFKMAARRPFCFFQLTHVQDHISLQINLILSVRMYDYKTLNEFDNHHDRIQNGRPVAILFFSVDTRSSPHFSTNQLYILHTCIYEALNKFKNRNDQIQNGCPAAILVTSEMTFRLIYISFQKISFLLEWSIWYFNLAYGYINT